MCGARAGRVDGCHCSVSLSCGGCDGQGGCDVLATTHKVRVIWDGEGGCDSEGGRDVICSPDDRCGKCVGIWRKL